MCSYLASFPAALTHAFIARYSRPGDVVLDPFSGRGTTPLQACAEGRIGVGNDLNPFAHLLTAAKVEPATRAQAATRLAPAPAGLERDVAPAGWRSASACRGRPGSPDALVPRAGSGASPPTAPRPVPVEVALAFHPRTLGQLLFVRTTLRLDDRTDRFLAAAITGILHGKSASYLSELMPNTFSMAPRYVRDFAARTGVRLARARRLRRPVEEARPALPPAAAVDRGHRPARRRPGRRAARPRRAASPRAARSGPGSWSPRRRTCGSSSTATTTGCGRGSSGFDAREIDATLDDAHHREPYLAFLRDVLAGLRPVLADDAVVVLVIGDVETDRGRNIRGGVGLAERAWEAAAEPEGYRLAGVALDDVAAVRKMTKLWGDEAGRATKTDRILVLGATEAGRRRALAGAPLDVDWTWPPRARSAAPSRMPPCSRCTTRRTWPRWIRWS